MLPNALLKCVPDEWLSGRVLIRAYQVLGLPRSALAHRVETLKLGDVTAVLFQGSINYQHLESAGVEQTGDHRYGFKMVGGRRDSPFGDHFALATPEDDEKLSRERLSSAAGFLAAFGGRALLHEMLLEVSVTESSESFLSPEFVAPLIGGVPRVDSPYLRFIEDSSVRLDALNEQTRNRVRLALRWFDMAVRDEGVDAFLKHWLALETLAMPDTTNIRPLEELLASHYGIGYADARERFNVRRLFGMRSDIVHNGDLRHPDVRLLVYVQALFMDALRATLGVAPAYRAARLLESDDFKDLGR